MAGSINGIIIELRGNPSELRKELEKIETIAGNLNKKLENGGTHWNKIGSSVENLGSTFEKIGNKVSSLGDKLTKNVTNLFLNDVGKIMQKVGDLGSALGTITSGVGTVTKAVGLMKNGIGEATGAAANLAKAMQVAFSPTGLVVGLVAAGVGLMISEFSKAEEENRKQAEASAEAAKKILEEKQAMEDLRNSINTGLQVDLEYIDRTQRLWEELQKITDENGKVKEGYEDRAKLITGELSKALETEIKLTDNVISNYQEMQKEIDNLILKKKGEAILNSSKKKYEDAMENKSQKQQELIDRGKELENAKQDEKTAYDKYFEIESNNKSRFPTEMLDYEIKKRNAKQDWKEKKRKVEEAQQRYDKLNEHVETYSRDIENYEYNLELFTRGTAEDIQQMIDNTGKTYISEGKTIDIEFQRRIKAEQNELNNAKLRNEEAVKNHNKTEEEKTQSTMNEKNRRIGLIVDELNEETLMVGENSEEVKEAWKQLATGSFDIYNEEVNKLPIITQQKIEEITGVAVTKTPEIAQVMEHLGTVGIEALENNEGFKNKALESLNSYMLGLSDEEKRKLLTQIGIQDVEKVMQGLAEGNLSEEAGMEILKNLDKGLRDEEVRKILFGEATSLANKLSRTLTISPTIKAAAWGAKLTKANIPGHKLGLDYVPYDNYLARLHKGERVLTAKENQQLINFEKMPKVIDHTSLITNQIKTNEGKIVCTTPNITFNVQKMDKANLDMAFNYINKRLGTQY